MSFMFPYDPVILAAVQNPPQTIPDVLQGLQAIDGLCVDEDSLKSFNGLYLAVTQAAQNRVNAGGFTDPGMARTARRPVRAALFQHRALRAYQYALSRLLGGDVFRPRKPADRQNTVCAGRHKRAYQP